MEILPRWTCIATRLGYSQLTLVDRIESVDLKAKKNKVRRRLKEGTK